MSNLDNKKNGLNKSVTEVLDRPEQLNEISPQFAGVTTHSRCSERV